MIVQKETKISFRGNLVTSKFRFYFVSSLDSIIHKLIKNKILQNLKEDLTTPNFLAMRKKMELLKTVPAFL